MNDLSQASDVHLVGCIANGDAEAVRPLIERYRAAAMPVHPDDRQYLLRFKLQRWWRRRMRHAQHNAG